MQLNARAIFATPRLNIWNIQEGVYDVDYEDGVTIKCNKKQIIFDRHCYELLTLFPNTPIVSSCSVSDILGDKEYYNADTHIKLLERIFKHICDHNKLNFYYQKEQLLRLTYETVNIIYNEIVQRISDCVSTIDATDFVSVIKNESIKNIHDNIKPNPESIDNAYKEIKSYVNSDKNNNRFVFAYRSKSINENQANQCIGPRGFVTDLDRTVFKQPIVNGFIRGMGDLYELVTESRTAAKSLNANDTQIKTSEYASRRIQLLTMSVTGVYPGDCGSTEYIDILVKEKLLENMKGKYYLDEETNTLKCIEGNEKHLINKILKIRTAFGCKVQDGTKVCTTCLGKVSENFKENSNLGYTMTAFLMEKLTQAILSTKHLTHSVKKSLIHLEGAAQKYFFNDTENNIYFNKELNLNGLYLILPNSKLSKLVDVLSLQHTNISLTKVGELEVIAIKDTKLKTPFLESVNISYKDRLSIITKPFLEYIKTIRLESDSRGNFVIPMDGFNKDFPIFYNPLKETNIISFVSKIASTIETNKDKVSDPIEKFLTIFDTVTEQFKCNMSVIETIVYATTTYNSFGGNYTLGRNTVHNRCEPKNILFRNRSVSGLLCFEDQISEIIKQAPTMFSENERLSHPMDVLFSPGSIVK